MPALSRFYGLTPADIDRMTPREVLEYLSQLRDAKREE